MNIIKNRYMWSVFATACLSANPAGVTAAPGPIADSPLFLTSSVQPNIFFLTDDSGSMVFEELLNEGTHKPGTDPYSLSAFFSNRGDLSQVPIVNPAPATYFLTDNESGFFLDFTIQLRRLTCRGYNVMAYDPNTAYTPWPGVDSAGNAYTNQTLTSARSNPYNPSSGTDISNHIFFPWNDMDKDGEYDGPASTDLFAAADAGVLNGGTDECGNVASNANGTKVSNLSAAQKTNYANWYSYYRSRDLVAKLALSSLVSSSTTRMGLGTLHNNNSVGTPIADIDNISLPVNATAATNKNTLLSQIFSIRPGGGTPLPTSLRNAGNYFKGSGTTGTLFNHLGSRPASPIQSQSDGGACQQNFTVLMSDGFWNGTPPSVGNTDGGTSNSPWDGGAFADGVSDTLADVAMKYYEEDLSTLDPLLNTSTADPNPEQHMVTYTVAFGLNGTLKSGPADGAKTFIWPTPVANALTTVDDMRHAAYNGRGEFLSARDPQELITSLGNAINNIQSRTDTAAAVSFNSTSLQTGRKVFRASFDSSSWHGNIEAFNLSDSGALTKLWDVASRLDPRDLTTNARNIITFNGTKGVKFKWPNNYKGPTTDEISSNQISDLLTNAPFAISTVNNTEITANTTYGQDILNYHRGDYSNEAVNPRQFRARSKRRLGDVIHAAPFFVGKPSAAYPDTLEGTSLTERYSGFVNTWKNRPARLYVGANDGMLHAFNADGVGGIAGDEEFAYIPNLVFSSDSGKGLHALAEKNYNHNYYVDLTPSVADVFIDTDGPNSGSPAAWKTVLVGGLRGGGKGIFALDITNPASINENSAANLPLWEFTHNDLGFTFSEVQIGRLHNGKWAAIFGNGYNNDPSGDGRAKLFIRYLDGSGTVILDTQAGSMVNNSCSDAKSDCNGLSTPALADLNGDAIIDRVYAGDLQGNLWVFDLTDTTPFDASAPNTTKWGFAYKDGAGKPNPLFQACTSTNCTAIVSGVTKSANRQPITAKPSLARHPNRSSASSAPNVLVYIGTGQYITSSDNASSATQSFYGIWDGGMFGQPTARTSPLKRGNLVFQTISEATAGQRTLTKNGINYNPNATSPQTPEYGWAIDLPTSRERVVVDSAAIGEIMFFSTLIPAASSACGGSTGFAMTVDLLTGGQPKFAVIDLNNDGDFSKDPVVGGILINTANSPARFISKGKNKFIRLFGAGVGQSGQVSQDEDARRISWRHLDY